MAFTKQTGNLQDVTSVNNAISQLRPLDIATYRETDALGIESTSGQGNYLVYTCSRFPDEYKSCYRADIIQDVRNTS